MSQIINFEKYKNKEKPDDFEIPDYLGTKFHTNELEDRFGNYNHWDYEEVLYLLEQIKNFVHESDFEGSITSEIAINFALYNIEAPLEDCLKGYLSAFSFTDHYRNCVE